MDRWRNRKKEAGLRSAINGKRRVAKLKNIGLSLLKLRCLKYAKKM